MNRRTRRTLLGVAAVLLLLAVAIFLRSKAPPEAARLLPESDGILFLNLKPIRALIGKHHPLRPPERAPEYQQFVDSTGMDWERDLDQAAVALHRMDNPNGPNGPVAYSLVLVGKITGQKLNAWLDTHATSRENYAGHIVFSIPSEDRTVRVAQVGYDMVAVSNFPTPEKIHSILDRHRSAGLPFAGSTLLSQHFHDVPLLSLAWGMGQIGLPFTESGAIHVLGFNLPLPTNSTFVASIQPEISLNAALRVRVEEFARSPEDAASEAASLQTLVGLARSFSQPLSETAANRGLKELLKSSEISTSRNRVVIKASLPADIFSKLDVQGDR